MYEGCIANSNEWSGFWARYAETVTYDACVSTGNGSAGFWMDFVANCAFKGVIAVGNAKKDRSMKDVPAGVGRTGILSPLPGTLGASNTLWPDFRR